MATDTTFGLPCQTQKNQTDMWTLGNPTDFWSATTGVGISSRVNSYVSSRERGQVLSASRDDACRTRVGGGHVNTPYTTTYWTTGRSEARILVHTQLQHAYRAGIQHSLSVPILSPWISTKNFQPQFLLT